MEVISWKRFGSLLFAAALTVSGCSGSTGDTGPQGEQGNTGPKGDTGTPGTSAPLTAETCTLCHASGQIAQADTKHDALAATALARGTATILTADFTPVSGAVKPRVTFKLKDGAGNNVANWAAVNFTIDKLVAATDTVPEHWQAYIYSGANPSREAGGTGLSSSSRTAGSSLSYDSGTQTYTYQFGTDIAATSAPAATYTVGDKIRIGMQITNYSATGLTTPAYDMTNGVADFDSAAGVVSANAALYREIVTTDACNGCHGKLVIHGRRVEVSYCATCHNAGLSDANGSGDLTQYIHKLHGREVLADATKTIFGGTVPQEITYPQDIVHCDTCHKGAQGARWNTNPSRYACTSCHDTISFESPPPAGMILHSAGACSADVGGCVGGQSCTACHTPSAVTASHTSTAEEQAKKFLPVIDSITPVSGKFPTVKFKIVDPTASNAPYALDNAAFKQGGASTLSLLVALSNADFQNAGIPGTSYGQALSVNLLGLTPGGAAVSGATLAAQAGDGSYTLTIDVALPSGATGSGTVAIQGHPAYGAGTDAIRLPMKNVSAAFKITDSSAKARRAVVDIAKCNACHYNLSLHGNNRTGDITTCTMCHNPEATDGSVRPATGTTADGKVSEGIDFKYMIHEIHGHGTGQGIVVYGRGGSVNDFREVAYPGFRYDCQACHVAGTYLQPAAVTKGTSTDAGADKASGTDNLRTTKYRATCGGCHDSGIPASHIEQNGGATGVTQAQIDALNQ